MRCLKIRERNKQIWSQQVKGKKTVATSNNSSWTILISLSAFGTRERRIFFQSQLTRRLSYFAIFDNHTRMDKVFLFQQQRFKLKLSLCVPFTVMTWFSTFLFSFPGPGADCSLLPNFAVADLRVGLFLLFTFRNHWNLLWVYQNGNITLLKGPTVSCWQGPFLKSAWGT